METINERFRFLREFLGLSQEDFAAKAHRTRSEIKNIEYCKTTPKEEVISSICATYGIREEWLKNGGDEQDMFCTNEQDERAQAFGELAARNDPIVNGFIDFLRSRTPDQLEMIAQQMEDFADFLRKNK